MACTVFAVPQAGIGLFGAVGHGYGRERRAAGGRGGRRRAGWPAHPSPRPGQKAIMDQRNLAFVPDVLVVQTGTAVDFPNSDQVRHQVYSFSDAKTFQLALYAGRAHAPVVFNRAGLVTLGCNIHDSMLGLHLRHRLAVVRAHRRGRHVAAARSGPRGIHACASGTTLLDESGPQLSSAHAACRRRHRQRELPPDAAAAAGIAPSRSGQEMGTITDPRVCRRRAGRWREWPARTNSTWAWTCARSRPTRRSRA